MATLCKDSVHSDTLKVRSLYRAGLFQECIADFTKKYFEHFTTLICTVTALKCTKL